MVENSMVGRQIPVAGVGIEALAAFLRSDRAPPDSMTLAELDGLLTAVAIGPDLVGPSEWLPLVWGEEGPVFADGGEIDAVIGGIMSRYNAIIHQVADETFEPLLGTAGGGGAVAEDWAGGFMLGMALRAEMWERLMGDEQAGLALFPILLLGADAERRAALGLKAEIEQAIRTEAPSILPACVLSLAAFCRERRSGTPGNIRTDRVKGAVRLGAKPGRNEPCPCGSGKKYKRCCGRD